MISAFLFAMMHKYANTKNKQTLQNAPIVSLCAFVEWFSSTQIVYPAVCLAVWQQKLPLITGMISFDLNDFL